MCKAPIVLKGLEPPLAPIVLKGLEDIALAQQMQFCIQSNPGRAIVNLRSYFNNWIVEGLKGSRGSLR